MRISFVLPVLLGLAFLIEVFPKSVQKVSNNKSEEKKRSFRDTKTFLTSGSKSRRHKYSLFKSDFHLENASKEELNRLLLLFRYAKHILKQVSPELLRAAKLMDLCLSSSTRNNSECKERDFTLLYLLPLNKSLSVPDHEMFGLLLKLITLLHQDYAFNEDVCLEDKMERLSELSQDKIEDQPIRACLRAIANGISEIRLLHKEFHQLLPKQSSTIDVYHKRGILKQVAGRLANVFSNEDRKLKLERVMMTSAFNMIEFWFYYGTEEDLRGSRKFEQEEAEQAAVKLIIEKIKIEVSNNISLNVEDLQRIKDLVNIAQNQGIRDKNFYKFDSTTIIPPRRSTVIVNNTLKLKLLTQLKNVAKKGKKVTNTQNNEGNYVVEAMKECVEMSTHLEDIKSLYTTLKAAEKTHVDRLNSIFGKLESNKDKLTSFPLAKLNDVIHKLTIIKSETNWQTSTFTEPLKSLSEAITELADNYVNLEIAE